MNAPLGRAAWPVLIASVLACGVALAQYRVVGGRALDANRRVGDYGINSRTAGSQALSISQPTYAARGSYGGRYRTANGLSRDRYYATGSPPSSGGATSYRPQRAYGYKAPTGAINPDPLWADRYRATRAGDVIQTAGGSVTPYSSGISRPLYRPIR